MTIPDPRAFILANTRLQPVSHTPEISLWLADEVTPIWRLTEEELGELGVAPLEFRVPNTITGDGRIFSSTHFPVV